jgi:hypothetical protein
MPIEYYSDTPVSPLEFPSSPSAINRLRRQDVEVESRTNLSVGGELVMAGRFSSNSMLPLFTSRNQDAGLEDIVTWQVSGRTIATQPGHHQEEKPHVTTKLVG